MNSFCQTTGGVVIRSDTKPLGDLITTLSSCKKGSRKNSCYKNVLDYVCFLPKVYQTQKNSIFSAKCSPGGKNSAVNDQIFSLMFQNLISGSKLKL